MTEKEVRAWITGRLPDDWFTEPPEVRFDRDEIQVIGRLPQPELGEEADAEDRALADRSRIEAWREETRKSRIRIARQAEQTLERTISWGARCGEEQAMFTTLSVPVMTRLRLRERRVLDTLIAAGVARSRSEALAWCVRLVGDNQEEWLADLREAIDRVHQVRQQGPDT
ncbi:MAG TPA: hypothetical protein VK070_12160 [Acidimicrobiia bacterium]|nr:hypothetical protein [Acidimicrobiia bacterium]